MAAPWTLRSEKRSLKCPTHCSSTPALLWITLYRASRLMATCWSLSACWPCLLVSTSEEVICIREYRYCAFDPMKSRRLLAKPFAS